MPDFWPQTLELWLPYTEATECVTVALKNQYFQDLLTAGLGQCPKRGQKAMGDDEAIAVRKYTLMADALPNAFPGGAVGIHRGDDHYSQVREGETD